MLLNKIVNHDLFFVWYGPIRTGFDIKHGKLRPRTVSGNGYTARRVLQFTHSLERSATSGRTLFTRGVCDATRSRITNALEVSASERKDSRHRLRWRTADNSLRHRPT